MALKIKYGKGKFSAGFTKPKIGNANKIHQFNLPNSADKINSTKGFSNRRRLQKENAKYAKQYNNTYNSEAAIRKQNNALAYATVNNAITQGVGGNTAREIAQAEAMKNTAMANRKPGSAQSSNKPGDISSTGGSENTDSTSSMGWIK